MNRFYEPDVVASLDEIQSLLAQAAIVWHDRQNFKPANDLARQAESLIRAIYPPTPELRAYLVESLTLRGEFAWVSGDFGDAFASIEEAIEIAEMEGLEAQLIGLLLLRGSLLHTAGEDNQAITHLVRTVALAKQYDQPEELVNAYMTLGAILGHQSNHADAADYFQQALTVAEEMGETRLIAAVLTNFAVIASSKGDLLDALDYGERARALFEQLDRPAGLATVHSSLGNTLMELGRFDEAHRHLQIALQQAVRTERPRQQLGPLGSIAHLHLRRGNFEEALATAHEMLALASELKFQMSEKTAHETLATIYEAMGDDHMALTHLKKYSALHAVDAKEQVTDRVEKLMLIHQVELAHAEAAHQQAEQALKEEVQRRQIFNDFIRDAAHDIRTPIAAITTSLYLYERVLDETKRERSLTTVKAKMKDLERILEDMFEMARLDSLTRLDLTTVDLNQLMQLVAQRIGPMAEAKAQTVMFEPADNQPKVRGDEVTLVRCLSNLAENAVYYTENSGRIVLRIRAEGDSLVRVEVQDSGRGIPPDDLPKIFNRFFRGDQARTTSGSGLGLAIAKRIVELHGGRLQVESEVGEGSTFRVIFRRVPPA